MNDFKIIELVLDDDMEMNGVEAISVVQLFSLKISRNKTSRS